MRVLQCGELSFAAARCLQDELVAARQDGRSEDTLLIVEHPPTLSLGIRANLEEPAFAPQLWAARGAEVVRADRGGEATFHGPGQLILYPVISLPERGLGVREFVRRGLQSFCDIAVRLGLPAEVRLDRAGVWLGERKKLASVGLRIQRGVTNHGFAFNITCDLSFFSGFPICGESQSRATSLQCELGELDKTEIREKTVRAFLRAVGCNGEN